MTCCCFFGHHDCPDAVKPLIRQKIVEIYEKHPDTVFYIGNQGRFDALVLPVVNGKIKYTNFGHEKYTTLRH